MKRITAFFLAVLTAAALAVNAGAAFVRENDLVIFNVGDPDYVPSQFYCQAEAVSSVENGKWVLTKTIPWAIAGVTLESNNLNIDLDTYKYMGFAYEATDMTNAQLFMYYCTDTLTVFDNASLTIYPLIADGKLHTVLTDDLSVGTPWKGTMTQIRYDLVSSEAAGTMKVSYFVFGKNAADVQAYMDERTPTAIKPNVRKDVKDCIWTGDGFIAYKMGYESMVNDFFSWSPGGCSTSVVNNTWCVEELTTTWAVLDMSFDVDITLDDYPYIAARYRTDGALTGGTLGYIYSTDTREATGEELVTIPLNNDGAWHTNIVNASANPFWTGHMNTLRVDLLNTEMSGKLYVDYILFAKDQATAEKFASGAIFEALPGEDTLLNDIYADGGVYGTVGSPRAGELVFMTEFDTALLSANAGMIEKVGMYVYSSANAGDASKWQVVDAALTELAEKDGKLAVMVKDIAAADFEKDAFAVPFVLYKNGTLVTGTGANAAAVSVSDFSQNLLGA